MALLAAFDFDKAIHVSMPRVGTKSDQRSYKNFAPRCIQVVCKDIVEMCYHSLYIFDSCGHCAISEAPLVPCDVVAYGRSDNDSEAACYLTAHPFKTWKLHRLCPACQESRDALMAVYESARGIKIEHWKWKVSYGLFSDGTDYWTRKLRDQEAAKQQQEEELQKKEKRRLSDRLGLRRRTKSSRHTA